MNRSTRCTSIGSWIGVTWMSWALVACTPAPTAQQPTPAATAAPLLTAAPTTAVLPTAAPLPTTAPTAVLPTAAPLPTTAPTAVLPTAAPPPTAAPTVGVMSPIVPKQYRPNDPGTPMGFMVATLANPNGTSEIFGFPLDGGATDHVTDGMTHDYAPAWSADGTRLAFLSNRDGGPGIYAELADRTFRRVAKSTPDAPISRVAWSPDGTRLVYDRNCSLETVRIDGSDRRTLLAPADGQDACFTSPSYAPDGSQIVFAATVDSSRSAIFTIDSNGGSPTQRTEIIPIPGSEQDPVFSPDGSKLAFASRRSGESYIYLAAADGSNQRRLTPTAPAEFHPTWSPDNAWIAFSTPDQREASIVAVSLLTGEQFALNEGETESDPAWRPTPPNQ